MLAVGCFVLSVSSEAASVVPAYTLLPEIVAEAQAAQADFPIVDDKGRVASIIYAEDEFTGVKRAARDLADDIERVSGKKAEIREVKTPRQLEELSIPTIPATATSPTATSRQTVDFQ